MKYYNGKKLFITGGSSGIGRCMALQAARSGATVVIGARGQDKLDAVLAELLEIGDGHAAISVDVSDAESVERAKAFVLETLGGIDILINCAGVAHAGYIEDIGDDIFRKMMDINYFGVVNVCRAFLPTFRAQRGGQICNVGSTLSFVSVFGYTPYAPSKFAVAAFSEALRQELLAYDVGVSVAYPADTDTPQYHYENKLKPEETKIINGTAGLSQPEDVSREILGGLARRKLHITPGFMNKIVRWAAFAIPFVVRWVVESQLRSYRKKHPLDAPQTHES